MERSLFDKNAWLRALLDAQQQSLRQMVEYNRVLVRRVAAYASEINRLKALVVKLQRMQFGKSSEKLRQKTERQVCEAQERITVLQEEMAEVLSNMILLCRSHCATLLPANRCRHRFRLKPARCRQRRLPARHAEANSARWAAISQSSWS